MTPQEYVISFLLGDKQLLPSVWYGSVETAPVQAKVCIVPSRFFDAGVYGTQQTLPVTPFPLLPDTDIPFLFGEPRLERAADGRTILYADLVASAYFMLSRYEEMIKPECRDSHGRFLAKDAVVFQQDYGMRPLVDEWGRYLRGLLREAGVDVPAEKCGFRKIYLTHDVDIPFLFYRKEQIVKQWVKNLIHYGQKVPHPLDVYRNSQKDPYYTFPKIIAYDKALQKSYGMDIVESIYFLIAAGSARTKAYCDIRLKKYQDLLALLSDSGATLGLHVSYEAGENPVLLEQEMQRLLDYCPHATTKSRHHFLRWTEPEHIDQMEAAGITEDFTLGYADSVGFRVGTCRPYYFINPKTRRVTDVLEHPMQVMECSLDRPNYMGLDYDTALAVCKQLISTVHTYYGELNVLWHNTSFLSEFYHERLYTTLFKYIVFGFFAVRHL